MANYFRICIYIIASQKMYSKLTTMKKTGINGNSLIGILKSMKEYASTKQDKKGKRKI